MKYLLDTHTLIWWDSEPEKLSTLVLAEFQNPDIEIFISLVSLWEMQIKQQLGKLTLTKSLDLLVTEQLELNDLSLLPIKPKHIYGLAQLPNIHKDPFDRLLISQARHEGMTLLSHDSVFKEYPVGLLW